MSIYIYIYIYICMYIYMCVCVCVCVCIRCGHGTQVYINIYIYKICIIESDSLCYITVSFQQFTNSFYQFFAIQGKR